MQILEVRHLQLVAAVADEGSLTRAGARLNLTQSALSHQLLDVEERLGTKLFLRATRRMALTEAGERVLASARRVLADLVRTEEELRLYAAHRRGVIRLTTQCYTVYHWLPAVMNRFKSAYPGIEIHIDVDATENPFEALLSGALDVALVSSERVERGIDLQPLFEDEMLVIVSPDHRFTGYDYVRAADLAEETLLTYSTLKGNTVYERLLRPAGLEPKKHMQVRLTEAMIEFARAGVGVAVLARWAAAPYIESGAVAAVQLTRRGFARSWKSARVAGRQAPPFIGAFIEAVKSDTRWATGGTTAMLKAAGQ
ncbi:MAG TPA: LysR family transcriptional regulator [Thermoanaerobaculia bacterium]|nr:LysR family transcriptional regulator [Thermoanaerobaculia bacterium]